MGNRLNLIFDILDEVLIFDIFRYLINHFSHLITKIYFLGERLITCDVSEFKRFVFILFF